MRKEKKKILLTGMDSSGAKYFYYCPRCKTINAINEPRCSECGKKRPRNAFDMAHIERPQVTPQYGMDIDRTVRGAYPTPPNPCFAVPMPTNGNYDPSTYMTNTAMGLPTYYQTDEYGRVYRAKVSYGALPCAGPVPVATPSKHVQTSAINVPINFNNQ